MNKIEDKCLTTPALRQHKETKMNNQYLNIAFTMRL